MSTVSVLPPKEFQEVCQTIMDRTEDQYLSVDRETNVPRIYDYPSLFQRVCKCVSKPVINFEEAMIFVGDFLNHNACSAFTLPAGDAKERDAKAVRSKAIETVKKLTPDVTLMTDGEVKMAKARFDQVEMDETVPSVKSYFAARVYNQALYHFVKGEFEHARTWFSIAAGSESMEGKHALAICLNEAIGGGQDMVRANQLYKEAADRGYVGSRIKANELAHGNS